MKREINLNQKLSLSTDVLVQDLANESTLINLSSESCFNQNEVATHMLFTLTESDSIQKAYNTLLNEYEVEPEKLKQDLFKFIDDLLQAGLVEISDN